jgi:hypothetical protein
MIGRSPFFFPAGQRVFSKPFQISAIEFLNGLAIIISKTCSHGLPRWCT